MTEKYILNGVLCLTNRINLVLLKGLCAVLKQLKEAVYLLSFTYSFDS